MSGDAPFGTGGAWGFVETMGLAAAIATADAMGKAAHVRVLTVLNADAGLLSVVCEGGLGACQAAVDAGRRTAGDMGALLRSNLIPRPLEDTEWFLATQARHMFKAGR